MAAEISNFGIAMTDNEGNLFKRTTYFYLKKVKDDATEATTSSDTRKGFYYNTDIANWETWTISLAGETIPLTDAFLAVVDTEGL